MTDIIVKMAHHMHYWHAACAPKQHRGTKWARAVGTSSAKLAQAAQRRKVGEALKGTFSNLSCRGCLQPMSPARVLHFDMTQ